MDLLYLRKRDPQQAFWDYAKVAPNEMSFMLAFLVDKDRVHVNAEMARRIFKYFYDLGFREEPTNLRTPVELVDYFDQPVSLAAAA